jgi:hypothetical protein
MAYTQKLFTDQEFAEAMERQSRIRVFQHDHVVGNGGVITRFDDTIVVIQSGVSDIAYHQRADCEFFELRK